MPAQTVRANRVFTYGQHDTDPPLEYQLIDERTGEPIVLSGTEDVYITVAHQQWSHYYYRTNPVVERGPCVITTAAEGRISWTPQAGDLAIVGMFDFSFEIDWDNDGSRVRTVRSLSYDHIRVQAPPGGRRDPLP